MSEPYRTTKSAGAVTGLDLTEQDLALINKHTLRALEAEEVYAFRLTLCDNRVDRDGERFTAKALGKLAALFVGKTGIFDHNPRASSQTARIFAAQAVEDPGKTVEGEPLTALVARAYMLRDDSTMTTIRSIEAGILKEVSVGCAVGRITCSVCGREVREEPCQHQKGKTYDGQLCHHRLEQPTDAYEWSFVAVPAQPGAGVTKSAEVPGAEDVTPPGLENLEERLQRCMEQLAERLLSEIRAALMPAQPEPPDDPPEKPPDVEDAAALLHSAKALYTPYTQEKELF